MSASSDGTKLAISDRNNNRILIWESIPDSNVGIQIGNYRLETVLIKDNVVKMAKAEKIQLHIEEDEDQ